MSPRSIARHVQKLVQGDSNATVVRYAAYAAAGHLGRRAPDDVCGPFPGTVMCPCGAVFESMAALDDTAPTRRSRTWGFEATLLPSRPRWSEPEAANLFFQLVSSRYERASLVVTSNKPFGRWGEVFGDDVVAAAMIDRLVHYADVVNLKGDSYRLKNRDLGRVPTAVGAED